MVFGFIGTTEVIIILIIALLVFGPQKIPEISRQIGSAYRELNKMRGEVSRALEFESYVQPYDMPPYEPATGTTYPSDSYNYDYDSDREYNALHQALSVPPPGPRVGPNVVLRPQESTVVDVDASGVENVESVGAGKSAEIGAEPNTKQ